MHKRYERTMPDRNDTEWRVEIWQMSDAPFQPVGRLELDADDPLLIDWEVRSKEEVICGSSATLRVISPGDRTYQDMYTIEPGSIRMDVYRDGSLYWSGTLDPEFYEEPYERASDYTVSLTFSDFGILDRLSYGLSEVRTLRELVDHCVERSGISTSGIDSDFLTSTCFTDGTKASLESLSIRSDNFYDEDGEPMSLKEVLEGILQPLAMRIVQKAGRVWVYDLNALYGSAPRRIEWSGDSSTMGTDKVANSVKVTFSPYADDGPMLPEVTYPYTVPDADDLTGTNGTGPDYAYYSYWPDVSDRHQHQGEWDPHLTWFSFVYPVGVLGQRLPDALTYVSPSARLFSIVPVNGSVTESAGIAWTIQDNLFEMPTHGDTVFNTPSEPDGTVLMRSRRVHIPRLPATEAGRFYLRVGLEVQIDPRYNPYQEKGDNNSGANYDTVNEYVRWVFLPFSLTLYDSSGRALGHYDNSGVYENAAIGSLSYAKGEWKPGAGGYGSAWLAYYDTNDPLHKPGIFGWKTNRHCIGRCDLGHFKKGTPYVGLHTEPHIYESFTRLDDGEYVPYPAEGGYAEITVYAGINMYSAQLWGELVPPIQYKDAVARGCLSLLRWVLYKGPSLEIVEDRLGYPAATLDDIEHVGYLHRSARDEISLETVCGSVDGPAPLARGVYTRVSDGSQVRELMRGGFTDCPERLLIGTLHSQFADRKTTLSGECVLDPGIPAPLTEDNQGDRLFMVAGEVQDAIAGTTDATYVEFRPDEYRAQTE